MMWLKFVHVMNSSHPTFEVSVSVTGQHLGRVRQISDGEWSATTRTASGDVQMGGWPTRIAAAAYLVGVSGIARDRPPEREPPVMTRCRRVLSLT